MSPHLRSCGLVLALASLAPATAGQSTVLDLFGARSAGFGRVCDIVGDTDGDGVPEILATMPGDSGAGLFGNGRVSLHSGATGSELRTTFGSRSSDGLGRSACTVGDVNGDGLVDYCAGTPYAVPDPGSVVVYSGLDGRVLHTFPGRLFFGTAVAGVGDANADGRDDVLVSSPNDRDAAGLITGSLTLFSGADGSVLQRVTGDDGVLGQGAGRVGDVDGDGRADFAGVQGNVVRVFSGASGLELWRRGCGRDNGTVSGGSDANGDGLDDVVIGAPSVSSSTGRVQLLSGRDGTLLHELHGTAPEDWFGVGVLGAGDLDGDGRGDFVVGATGFDGAAGTNTGAVRAYSGRTGALIGTVEGDQAGDSLGLWVGGGRDVDGDGVPEVVAGGHGLIKVVSFVPRGLAPFGTGSPGCRGSSSLLANGVPALGKADFALHVANAGAAPLLLLGDSEDTAGTLRLRALFHLDLTPPPPGVGLLLLRPLPDPDLLGTLVVPFPIPADPSLLGRTFVLQVASLYPPGTCAQILTTSRGLRLTVQ